MQKFLSILVERVVKNHYFVTIGHQKRRSFKNYAFSYSVNQRIKPVEQVVPSDA